MRVRRQVRKEPAHCGSHAAELARRTPLPGIAIGIGIGVVADSVRIIDCRPMPSHGLGWDWPSMR